MRWRRLAIHDSDPKIMGSRLSLPTPRPAWVWVLTLLTSAACRTPVELGCGTDTACQARQAAQLRIVTASPPAPSPPPASVATAVRTSTAILISVDGLAPRFIDALACEGELPTFSRLQKEGAFTHNARTEARISVTLPNHISMITGRPAVDVPGASPDTAHRFMDNVDPGENVTLHQYNPALPYLQSAFDVVHDAGGYTALFAGKSKFAVLNRSYSSPAALPDAVPPDNGSNKIDTYGVNEDTETLVTEFITALEATAAAKDPPRFAMLHIRDTDSAGHSYGWGGTEYLAALRLADASIGRVLESVKAQPQLSDALIVVTTDHGGLDYGHYEPQNPNIGVIPFYLWGSGVPAGTDLYVLAGASRRNPGNGFPMDEAGPQPIRNGDAANLLLPLLGLEQIPGALHRDLTLNLTAPPRGSDAGTGSSPPPLPPSDASAPALSAPVDAAN